MAKKTTKAKKSAPLKNRKPTSPRRSAKKTPARGVDFKFHPLTPDRWKDFETLFGPRGACGGCWCMAWRLPRAEWEGGKGSVNRDRMHAIVKDGDSPGVLAYADGQAVGWCSVAPRQVFVALERSRVLKPIDDQPVWSITCFFVHKDYRRLGLSTALIAAAVDFAAKRGAKIIEGYPVEPYSASMPAVFAWVGIAAAYKKAGFSVALRRSKARPIMRREIAPRRAN